MIVNTGMMREPIIHDTMANAPKDIKERHLAGLVSKTTGVPMGSPMMSGVLEHTVPASRRDVPEIHKVPKGEVGKTKTKRMGQVAFAGPKY
jgi:hypothetical protein